MKSKAPQLHLEYRFYKLLGTHGEYFAFTHEYFVEYHVTRLKGSDKDQSEIRDRKKINNGRLIAR